MDCIHNDTIVNDYRMACSEFHACIRVTSLSPSRAGVLVGRVTTASFDSKWTVAKCWGMDLNLERLKSAPVYKYNKLGMAMLNLLVMLVLKCLVHLIYLCLCPKGQRIGLVENMFRSAHFFHFLLQTYYLIMFFVHLCLKI